jgi:diguanylate cyclase
MAGTMSIPIDYDHVSDLAERALQNMQAYRVPATPRNFEIWYTHATGVDAELAKALDAVFANGGEWSETIGDSLNARFFPPRPDTETLAEIGSAFGAELKSMMQAVNVAGRETQTYGHALDMVAGQMDRGLDGARLELVVRQIAASTRSMRARTEALEGELARTSREVELLRVKNEAIRREARTDALTSLANRKHFEERLAEASMIVAEGHEVCLVMGDVDHFKAFNDTWGHQIGDQVLRLVGSCFSDNVKGRDTAARYGGEEFAIILTDTTLENAKRLADHIRSGVQTKKVVKRSSGETLGTITISMGVARLAPDENPADAMRRADACLYRAKRSGRNRVIGEDDVLVDSEPRVA